MRTALKLGGAPHGKLMTFVTGRARQKKAMNAYIDLRRSQSRRPFIDGPHFEKN